MADEPIGCAEKTSSKMEIASGRNRISIIVQMKKGTRSVLTRRRTAASQSLAVPRCFARKKPEQTKKNGTAIRVNPKKVKEACSCPFKTSVVGHM